MSESTEIFEKYAFFSTRKEREIFATVLEAMITMPLSRVGVRYTDQPDQEFDHLNDRAKKILLNLEKPERVEAIEGDFSDGGQFELRNGALSILIPSDQYNFELVDFMKRFLSPIFPLCVFRNPYIWGVDLYVDYEREQFFQTRAFIARSKILEEPEIDIFRRDNGIIFKFRFHPKEEFETDAGIKFLAPLFLDMTEAIRKRNFEGVEVLHVYCTDRKNFRRFEARTKLGRDVKAALSET